MACPLWAQQIDTRVHEAAFAGDTALLRQHLSDGWSATRVEGGGRAPLFFAAAAGHVPVIVQLMRHGVYIDTTDNDGWTALMVAARNGQLEAVRTLLMYGADGTLRDADGQSAFGLSVNAGHLDVAGLLQGTDSPFSQMERPPRMPDRVYLPRELDLDTEEPVTLRVRGEPEYPDQLLQTGVEGHCIGSFVIGIDGRPDPSTYETVRCTHMGFAMATREALLRNIYLAARIEGDPVRVRVEQSVTFAIQR